MSWLDLSKWPWKVFGASCEKKAPFPFIFLTSSPSSRLHAVCRYWVRTRITRHKPPFNHENPSTIMILDDSYHLPRSTSSKPRISVYTCLVLFFQSLLALRARFSHECDSVRCHHYALCLYILPLGHYLPIRGFYGLDYNWYHISNKNSIKLIRICIEWRCVPENSHTCNPLFAYILLPIRMDWLGGSHMTYVK